MWQQWILGVLGLWVIALAFLGITGTAMMWTLVVTGLVVAVLGFWGGAGRTTNARMHPSYR